MIDEHDDDAVVLKRLSEAMGRLHSFAVLRGPGEVIDDTSGLTSEDLALLLDTLEKVHAIAKVAPKQ